MSLDERGITLPEILIATVLIGIGLIGLMVVVPVAAVGIQDGNQTSLATFLAQQRLEEARHRTWTDTEDCLGASASATAEPVPTGGTCAGVTTATFADEDPVVGFTQYRRVTRITDCGLGAGCSGIVDSRLRLVQVTVGYRPLTGGGVAVGDKSVVLEWLVTRR